MKHVLLLKESQRLQQLHSDNSNFAQFLQKKNTCFQGCRLNSCDQRVKQQMADKICLSFQFFQKHQAGALFSAKLTSVYSNPYDYGMPNASKQKAFPLKFTLTLCAFEVIDSSVRMFSSLTSSQSFDLCNTGNFRNTLDCNLYRYFQTSTVVLILTTFSQVSRFYSKLRATTQSRMRSRQENWGWKTRQNFGVVIKIDTPCFKATTQKQETQQTRPCTRMLRHPTIVLVELINWTNSTHNK